MTTVKAREAEALAARLSHWDIAGAIEAMLLVAEKPVPVSQFVDAFMAQFEDDLDEGLIPEPVATSADPAFNAELRSDVAAAQLADESAAAEAKPTEKAPLTEEQKKRRKTFAVLVQQEIDRLLVAYGSPDRQTMRGFELSSVAGGYQFRTSAASAPFVRQFLHVRPTKLSRAQLETLAIVAYRQPTTRPEIEHIRGVDCGASLKVLLDRRLVRIVGKKEVVGNPLLYGTTEEFLEFFKLNSLLDLPTLREFQELTDEHRRVVEEELASDAPLGNLAELAAGAAGAVTRDDSELMGSLDQALEGAKQTVTRVAELTGLAAADEAARESQRD